MYLEDMSLCSPGLLLRSRLGQFLEGGFLYWHTSTRAGSVPVAVRAGPALRLSPAGGRTHRDRFQV